MIIKISLNNTRQKNENNHAPKFNSVVVNRRKVRAILDVFQTASKFSFEINYEMG